jgi:hypothetical protein
MYGMVLEAKHGMPMALPDCKEKYSRQRLLSIGEPKATAVVVAAIITYA